MYQPNNQSRLLLSTANNSARLSHHLSNQTVVDRSEDGAVDGSNARKKLGSTLNERDDRASEDEKAGLIDRSAGAHVLEKGRVHT